MIRRALTWLGLAAVTLGVLVGIWVVVSLTTDRPVTYESNRVGAATGAPPETHLGD